MYKSLQEDSIFFYSKDIELLFIAVSVLSTNTKNIKYEDIYSSKFMDEIRAKYFFLFSLHQQVKLFGLGLIEVVADIDIENFNLDYFKQQLLEMDQAEFISYFIGQSEKRTIIQNAIQKNEISKLYHELPYISENIAYLPFEALFFQSERIIKELIECAGEFETTDFLDVVNSYSEKILIEEGKIKKSIEKMTPLQLSEELMGKTFKRIGPYEKFYFMPSNFLPFRCARYMSKNQVLFYAFEEMPLAVNDIVKILKVIADETRFTILEILALEGPMIGKTLADKLSIAASTLSHHMEQLSSIGILHEEKIKNSKYYSINQKVRIELMKKLSEMFGNK